MHTDSLQRNHTSGQSVFIDGYSRKQYIMDDPNEAARLDAKVNPDDFIQHFLQPVLKPGDSENYVIVDVGCGAGAIVSAAARKFPSLQFIGVDISTPRLAEAKKKTEGLANIGFRQASAYELPFETSSVDVLYTRFMVEYLADPVAAIAEMGRVIKPGGRVIVQDVDGQMMFQYPYAIPEIETVFTHLAKTGYDPLVGRKLYTYSRQAGLQYVSLDLRPYHFFVGRIDADNERFWEMKFDNLMPMAAEALGSQEAAQAFKRKYMDFLRDPDTLLYSTLFTLYVTKS
jgi:ubiquinone/menaquinone biosynthesis C-methylase UbiE